MAKLKWTELKGTGYTSWVSGISKDDFKIVKLNEVTTYRLRVEGLLLRKQFKTFERAQKVAQLIHNG